MSFQPPNFAQKPYAQKPGKKIRSTWVVAILAALFLVLCLSTGEGGFGMWVLLMGLFLLLTSVYALVFRRPSWARLFSPAVRKRAVAVGGAVTIVGFVIAGMTLPATEETVEPVAETTATPTPSKTSTPKPTKSTAAVAAGKACVSAGARETVTSGTATPTPTSTSSASATATPTPTASKTAGTSAAVSGAVFVCTEDDKGKLVWMDEEDSKKSLAERQAAADKEAADKKAAEEAAAAERQRIADEAAAAEAQRIADEQAAAAAEAQRIAEEQARQQQYVAPAPAPAAPAPAPAPAPGPGVVHPGSFCSPGGAVGVTSKGTPMVCGPGSDGRLRWRSA